MRRNTVLRWFIAAKILIIAHVFTLIIASALTDAGVIASFAVATGNPSHLAH